MSKKLIAKHNKPINKKAYFFIMDALIGIGIMLGALAYFYSIHFYEPPKNQVYILSENLINLLSETKLIQLNNNYKDQLVLNSNITNTDNTILEQVNEFEYFANQGCTYCRQLAAKLLENVTSEVIEPQFNFKLSLNGNTIYERATISEDASSLRLKTSRVVYTVINGSSIYGPNYAEISFWQ